MFMILYLKKYKIYTKKLSLQSKHQLSNYFNKHITYGGFPDVILATTNDNKRKELQNLVDVYLLKEIREILHFENEFEYLLLLKRLSANNGSIVNYSNISKDINVHSKRVKEMISILEKTGIISIITPFFENTIKEMIKSPKIYFNDLGFRNQLISNFSDIEYRQDKGEMFENFFVIVCRKFGIVPQFYNIKNQYEVDFCIMRNGKKYFFEIKSKLNSSKLTPSMKKAIKYENIDYFYVLNKTIEDEFEFENTKIKFDSLFNVYSILQSIQNFN